MFYCLLLIGLIVNVKNIQQFNVCWVVNPRNIPYTSSLLSNNNIPFTSSSSSNGNNIPYTSTSISSSSSNNNISFQSSSNNNISFQSSSSNNNISNNKKRSRSRSRSPLTRNIMKSSSYNAVFNKSLTPQERINNFNTFVVSDEVKEFTCGVTYTDSSRIAELTEKLQEKNTLIKRYDKELKSRNAIINKLHKERDAKLVEVDELIKSTKLNKERDELLAQQNQQTATRGVIVKHVSDITLKLLCSSIYSELYIVRKRALLDGNTDVNVYCVAHAVQAMNDLVASYNGITMIDFKQFMIDNRTDNDTRYEKDVSACLYDAVKLL
jgi:hypothetical protein